MSCCQILDTALQLSATQHCTPPLRGASHLLRNTVFRAHSFTLAQRDFYRARAYFTVYFTQNKKEKKIDKDFRTLWKITLPDPRFFFGSSSTAAHTEQLRPKMFTFVYHWNISHQFLSIQVILRHHQEWHRLQANTELLLRKNCSKLIYSQKVGAPCVVCFSS